MIHKFSTYGRPHRLASRLVFYVSCSIASQSVQYITFECHGCRTSFNITFECHGIHIVQSSGLLQPHIIVWHTYLHRCSDTSDADASEMSWGEVWRKEGCGGEKREGGKGLRAQNTICPVCFVSYLFGRCLSWVLKCLDGDCTNRLSCFCLGSLGLPPRSSVGRLS